MTKNLVFFLSKKFITAICVVIVLLVGISYDPQQAILEAARRAALTFQSGSIIIEGLNVSEANGVYFFSENITGFKPGKETFLPLRKVFDQTGVAIDKPAAMMAANMHSLSYLQSSASAEGEAVTNKSSTGKDTSLPASADAANESQYPPVGLYCTHNSESYYPDSKESRVEGGKGLINQVAKAMAEDLQKNGIQAVFDDTVHDSPDYNISYSKSRETIERLVKKGDWSAFIDVHRDAIPEKNTPAVVKVDEEMAAQMLIIVGSDQREPNPNWGTNLDFAEKIFKQGEKMYPGLIRGVRIKPGTYNQEIHPPSILVEVGNDYNSLKEAEYSAELFADILSSVIREGS